MRIANRCSISADKRSIPQISDDIGDRILYMQHFEVLYGYRPADPIIFFLNSWEFMMWWTVMPKSSKHVYSQTHFIFEFPEAALQLREKYIFVAAYETHSSSAEVHAHARSSTRISRKSWSAVRGKVSLIFGVHAAMDTPQSFCHTSRAIYYGP